MIYGVKGSPGAGKSYYAMRKLVQSIQAGKYVVTNLTLREDWEALVARRDVIGRLSGKKILDIERFLRKRYYQLDPDDPEAIRDLFRVRLRGEKEGRGVAILDEAHNWLNARMWTDDDRAEYVRWFTQHRKLGFDVYLISQAIESIDAQIRRLIEYKIVIRNLKRFRVGGIPLIPVNIFIAITLWESGPGGYQAPSMITKREVFPLSWYRRLYETHGLSHGLDELERDDAIWLPAEEAEPERSRALVRGAGATLGALRRAARVDTSADPQPGEEAVGDGDPSD